MEHQAAPGLSTDDQAPQEPGIDRQSRQSQDLPPSGPSTHWLHALDIADGDAEEVGREHLEHQRPIRDEDLPWHESPSCYDPEADQEAANGLVEIGLHHSERTDTVKEERAIGNRPGNMEIEGVRYSVDEAQVNPSCDAIGDVRAEVDVFVGKGTLKKRRADVKAESYSQCD